MKEYKKRTTCAVCDSKNLTKIFELGTVPLAGYFPTEEERKIISSYELNINLCDKCGLVQSDSLIDPDILFKDYRYISSVGLQKHFNELADYLNQKYDVKNKNTLDIGCNDGVLVEPLKKLGASSIGIDPASNICKLAIQKGLNVINDYFNYNTAKKYNFKGKFDIITSTNSFAHISDIKSVMKGVEYSLKKGGVFIIEVHYLKNLIEEIQWDFIYHEHIYYYSLSALNFFAEKFGLKIIDFEEIPIHSGSIRVTMTKPLLHLKFSKINKIEERLKLEQELGLTSIQYFKNFSERMKRQISDFKEVIEKLKLQNKIIAYGASGRANMFCNIVGLSSKDIEFIIDESPERYGRYIANTDIPIYPKEKLNEISDKKNTYIVIMAWNYADMIMSKLPDFSKFIIPFPNVKLIEK